MQDNPRPSLVENLCYPTHRPCGYSFAMHFGSLVRKLRGERGMSQERLAVAAGLSAATVNRLERSESGPHRSTATAILVALEGGGRTRLTEEERAAFLHASGLEHLVASLQGSFDVIPLRAFTAGLSPDAARVYWAVADLMERQQHT